MEINRASIYKNPESRKFSIRSISSNSNSNEIEVFVENILNSQSSFHSTDFLKSNDQIVSVVNSAEKMRNYLSLRAKQFIGTGKRAYENLAPTADYFIEPCDYLALHSWVIRNDVVRYAIRMQAATAVYENPNYADFTPVLSRFASSSDVLMTRFFTPNQRAAKLSGTYALFRENYAANLRAGGRIAFLTCSDDHVRFFSKIGFENISGYTCRHVGEQNLMRLEMHNRTHLAAVRSPLLAVYDDVKL